MTFHSADMAESTSAALTLPPQTYKYVTSQQRRSFQLSAVVALKTAAISWFVVAVIGQLIFASYVMLFYGPFAARGNWAAWNKRMTHGYVPGDTIGNVAIGLHLLFAVAVNFSGAIQLIPQVRNRAPSFHRLNGRIYILAAFIISIGGLYGIWLRGTVGNVWQHIATSINGVLMMLFAAIALRYALARKFAIHRRWALRLFIVMGGVWFARIGYAFWVFINNGPLGETAVTIWNFGQFLLPLGILELYLRTRDRGSVPTRFAVAALLFVLSVATGIGIYFTAVRSWLPQVF
jgi:hypothetical protein